MSKARIDFFEFNFIVIFRCVWKSIKINNKLVANYCIIDNVFFLGIFLAICR